MGPPRVLGLHRTLGSHRALGPPRFLGPLRVLGPVFLVCHSIAIGEQELSQENTFSKKNGKS